MENENGDGLIERLRSQRPLPVCPYDRRSPDYWTAPNDAPCTVCGSLNEDGAPDLCTGADTRVMDEAATALEAANRQLAIEVQECKAANSHADIMESRALKAEARLAEAEKVMTLANSELVACSEYLDGLADADGDSEGFHTNREMSLQGAVNEAIRQSDAFLQKGVNP